MLKNKSFIIPVLLVMVALIVLKFKSGDEKKEVPAIPEQTQQEETEGVSLPDAAKDMAIITVNNEATDYSGPIKNGPTDPMYLPKKEEEQVTVDGNINETGSTCKSKYMEYHLDVALYYQQNEASGMLKDYSLCHALLTSDKGMCFLSKEKELCESQVDLYRTVYTALRGRTDMKSCMNFFGKINMGISANQFCGNMAGYVNGTKDAPPQMEERTKFLSGNPLSCAGMGKQDRYDCILLADIVSGARTGVSKYFAYDALARNSCVKVDSDLVDKYCKKQITKDRVKGKK